MYERSVYSSLQGSDDRSAPVGYLSCKAEGFGWSEAAVGTLHVREQQEMSIILCHRAAAPIPLPAARERLDGSGLGAGPDDGPAGRGSGAGTVSLPLCTKDV